MTHKSISNPRRLTQMVKFPLCLANVLSSILIQAQTIPFQFGARAELAGLKISPEKAGTLFPLEWRQ